MTRIIHAGLTTIVILLPAVTGCCAPSFMSLQTSAFGCEPGDQAMVRDMLYFGRNRPDCGKVSQAEWDQFLNEVVTPRFPGGLTVARAVGQWRGASGKVEREVSEVVTVLHTGEARAREKIVQIAAAYKQRFGQEAVLRERSAACTQL
jgi:hypothetical protein